MSQKKKIFLPESKTNKAVEISDIPKGDSDVMTPEHRRALARQEARQQFTGVAEEFAESKFFHRNYKFDTHHKLFPGELEHDLRMVDKCYPYAKGGLLLVDEPRTEKKLAESLKKQPKLKQAGFRFVIVEDFVEGKSKELATSPYDLAVQLGET